ncbi:hypothetical protein FRC00_001029 [Tulasnella sp. 408]|nr:hypothetical protein FRC00_001029 [Tulasnella sp. 408]
MLGRVYLRRGFASHPKGLWRTIPPTTAPRSRPLSTSIPRPSFPSSSNPFSKRYLWLAVPAGALVALYASPKQESPVPALLASPSIIPVTPREPRVTRADEEDYVMSSLNEPHLGQRIAAFVRSHILEPIGTGLRFLHLTFYFLPVICSWPIVLIGNPIPELDGERWGAIWWYDLLTRQMQRAGPTFIKVYRATLRKDVLPPSYLLPKRPRPKHLKPTIAADGVVPPPPPPVIPSGSVAVKVLHPRVDKMINRDLKIMKFFADWIATVPGLQWISLPEEVAVFGEMMREQLDLRGEASNLTTFEKNFNGRRENAVSFPRPLTEYSTREVLIEEFEEALPLGHFLRNGGGAYDQVLATLGLDVFLGYRAGKLMVERCRTPELVVDEEIFALKIQHLALSVKAKTFSLGQIKIADVLTEVLRNVQTHHVKMEGDFVNTIVSMLLLEGIGRQLDPDMDLFKSALPILRKLGRQMSVNDVNLQNARSFGAMLKFWVWVEARELAHSAFQDADDFIRYDWLASPSPSMENVLTPSLDRRMTPNI